MTPTQQSQANMLRHPLARTLGLVLGYVLCFWAVRLITLTLVAFTFVRSRDAMGANSGLQRIADIMRANQVLTYGVAAAIFVLILHGLHPLTRTRFGEVFNWPEFKGCFAPNALGGLILTSVMIVGAMLGGHMSYLGIYMRFDEVALSLGSAMIFGACLVSLIVVEEYILRRAVESRLYEQFGVIPAVACSSVIAIMIKNSQFELSWLQVINLVLLNLTLSMIARNEKSFMASTSFAATFAILTHVIFGLPFMGQDMPGLFLLRSASDEGLGGLLSGGAAGPEGGLVLTVLLVIYLYLPQIRSKKA